MSTTPTPPRTNAAPRLPAVPAHPAPQGLAPGSEPAAPIDLDGIGPVVPSVAVQLPFQVHRVQAAFQQQWPTSQTISMGALQRMHRAPRISLLLDPQNAPNPVEAMAISIVAGVEGRITDLLQRGDLSHVPTELCAMVGTLSMPMTVDASLPREAFVALERMKACRSIVRAHMLGAYHYFHKAISPRSFWHNELCRNLLGFDLGLGPFSEPRDVRIKAHFVQLSWLIPAWFPRGTPDFDHYAHCMRELVGKFLASLNTSFAALTVNYRPSTAEPEMLLQEVLGAVVPECCSPLLAAELRQSEDIPAWLYQPLRAKLDNIRRTVSPLFPATANPYMAPTAREAPVSRMEGDIQAITSVMDGAVKRASTFLNQQDPVGAVIRRTGTSATAGKKRSSFDVHSAGDAAERPSKRSRNVVVIDLVSEVPETPEMAEVLSAPQPFPAQQVPQARSPEGGEVMSETEDEAPPTPVPPQDRVSVKLEYDGHTTPAIRRPLPVTPSLADARETPDIVRIPSAPGTPQWRSHTLSVVASPVDSLVSAMSQRELDMDAIQTSIQTASADGSWLQEAEELVQVMVTSQPGNQNLTVLGWLRAAQQRRGPGSADSSNASNVPDGLVQTLTGAGILTTTSSITTSTSTCTPNLLVATPSRPVGEVTARLQLLDELDGIPADEVGYVDLSAPAGPPVIVKGPQKYLPDLDSVFPVRNPRSPKEVHPDYRDEQNFSRCHPKVRVKAIRLQKVLLPATTEDEPERRVDAAHHLMGYLGYFPGAARFKKAADLGKAIEAAIREDLEANLKGEAAPSSKRIRVVEDLRRDQCDNEREADALEGQKGVVFVGYAPEDQPSIANGCILGIFAGARIVTDQDLEDYRQAVGYRADMAIHDYGAHLSYKRGTVDWAPYGGGNSMQYLNSSFSLLETTGRLCVDPSRTHAVFVRFNADVVKANGQWQTEPMYAVVQIAPVAEGMQPKLDYGEGYELDPVKEEPAQTHG